MGQEKSAANAAIVDEILGHRGRLRWSHQKLYDAADVPSSTYYKYIRGERDMTVDVMVRLCRAMEVDPSEVVRSAEIRKPEAFRLSQVVASTDVVEVRRRHGEGDESQGQVPPAPSQR